MYRLTGARKQRRDQAVRDFEFQHPHYTEKEIGDAFGISQSAVSRILNEKKGDEK